MTAIYKAGLIWHKRILAARDNLKSRRANSGGYLDVKSSGVKKESTGICLYFLKREKKNEEARLDSYSIHFLDPFKTPFFFQIEATCRKEKKSEQTQHPDILSPLDVHSTQQLLDLAESGLLPRPGPLARFLLESRHHELPLLGLDVQHAVLDGPIDDEPPDGGGFRLAEAMDAVDGLILQNFQRARRIHQ